MKTSNLIIVTLIILSIGLISMDLQQDYKYRLTIDSTNGTEQRFNVEINSTSETSPEPVKTLFSDQTAPFTKNLESGTHEIIVEYEGEKGSIVSKVTGILDGKTMGSASSDTKKTILKAGPGGRYSASK